MTCARRVPGRSLPRYLSVEEVDRLIAQPDVSTARGLRDRALIELLYATGMRVSELLSLRPADVNLDASYLTCTGKGVKQRIVPFGDAAGAWVSRYAREARPALLGRRSSPRLFVNARGGGPGLTRIGFWKILKGYAAAGRRQQHAQPAHAAAFVCDAPAGARRGSARDPDDARARGPVDDADLHARARAADAQRLRPLSSARMRRRSRIAFTRAHEALKVLACRSSPGRWPFLCCCRQPECSHAVVRLAWRTRQGPPHVRRARRDPRPHAAIGRQRHTRAGGCGRGESRPAVHHPDRSRRRHAGARASGLSPAACWWWMPSRSAPMEGHVVALGLPKTPYPLGGEARDMVEDIARMGGMSVAAHPGSPKPQLRWTEWTSPFNGLEWLNGDSEWRDEPWPDTARAFSSHIRSDRSDRWARCSIVPTRFSRRWDALTAHRRVVALAGSRRACAPRPERR